MTSLPFRFFLQGNFILNRNIIAEEKYMPRGAMTARQRLTAPGDEISTARIRYHLDAPSTNAGGILIDGFERVSNSSTFPIASAAADRLQSVRR
jgi:hypothetical protein